MDDGRTFADYACREYTINLRVLIKHCVELSFLSAK